MRLLLLLCSICCWICAYAQVNDFPALRSAGEPPVDFTTTILSKSASLRAAAKRTDIGFQVSSNNFLNELLSSGKVVYGDTLTNYLNRIVDKLLEDNPDLRSELRIYTLRSSEPNAMCLFQGVIFVTTGLISLLDSEDELAFILAHELNHYVKEHSLKQYDKRIEMQQNRSQMTQYDLEASIKQFYQYSRENETEADVAAFHLFVKKGYDPRAAMSSLKKLENVWKVFQPVTWTDAGFRNNGFNAVPARHTDSQMLKRLLKDRNWEIESRKKVVQHEEFSTHPELKARIKTLKDIMGKDSLPTGNIENSFAFYKWTSCQDLAMLYYLNSELSKTILILDYIGRHLPENDWRRSLKYTALYRYIHMQEDRQKERGNKVQFSKLNRTALPEEKPIYNFLNALSNDTNLRLLAQAQQRWAGSSEYDIYEISSAYYERRADEPNSARALAKMKRKVDPGEWTGLKIAKERRKHYLAYQNNLGAMDSIILFLPNINVQRRVRNPRKHILNMEDAQNSLYEAYALGTKKLNMNNFILDNRIGADFNTEAYNSFCMVKEWMQERMSWDTLVPGTMRTRTELAKDERLENMQYINWSSYLYTLNQRDASELEFCGACIGGPMIPIYLIVTMIPVKNVYTLQILMDWKTGKFSYISFENFRHKYSTDLMNAQVFRTLYMYKKGIKK